MIKKRWKPGFVKITPVSPKETEYDHDVWCDCCLQNIYGYKITFSRHFSRNYCKSCLASRKAIKNPLILNEDNICDGCEIRTDRICVFSTIKGTGKTVFCYCRDCIRSLIFKLFVIKGRLESKFHEFTSWSKTRKHFSSSSHKQKRKRQFISKGIRHEVFQRDNYRCLECGATPDISPLEIDHIIPVSRGGTDEMSNLQTLCYTCNREKSDLIFKGGGGK